MQPSDYGKLGLREAFSIRGNNPIVYYSKNPPSLSEIEEAEPKLGTVDTDSFYGKRRDIPGKKFQYGLRKFDIRSQEPVHLPAFGPDMGEGYGVARKWPRVELPMGSVRTGRRSIWRYALEPPTLEEACKWESDMLSKSGEFYRNRLKAQAQDLSQVSSCVSPAISRAWLTSVRLKVQRRIIEVVSGATLQRNGPSQVLCRKPLECV